MGELPTLAPELAHRLSWGPDWFYRRVRTRSPRRSTIWGLMAHPDWTRVVSDRRSWCLEKAYGFGTSRMRRGTRLFRIVREHRCPGVRC